jgi:hypothetical protein
MYVISEKPSPSTPHRCESNDRMVPGSIRFDADGVMFESRQCSICDKIWEIASVEDPF